MTMATGAHGTLAAVRVREATESVDAAAAATSWGAIIGGSVVIAATALILLALGAGFGLSSVSPWPSTGASAKTFAVMTGIWLIIVQWVSSGLGGYVAGRLRSRWTGLHTEEISFRDTAHGVVAWAVAAVVTAAFLASAISAIVTSSGTAATGRGTAGSELTSPSAYLVDSLFRPAHPEANATANPNGNPNAQAVRSEATRIMAAGLGNGDLSPADRTYLAQLVAARTGLSQDDAQKRVDQTEQKARQDADAARRAGRNLAFFTAFSMLIGAFIAGIAAKIGGDHRDALG